MQSIVIMAHYLLFNTQKQILILAPCGNLHNIIHG